jgi:hypothetical protein
VKLADKTSNVRDVGSNPAQGWSDARRLKYLDWAKEVVDALPVKGHPLTTAFATSLAQSLDAISRSPRDD